MDVSAIIAIIGGIAFIVGLFGGGIEVKEIRLPQISIWLRIVSILAGVVFIGMAIWLSYPSPVQLPEATPQLAAAVTPDTPTATLIPPTNTPMPPTYTLTLESPTDTPVPKPTDTPTPKPPTDMPEPTDIPTPTPTATIDADPTVYDNFNNPAFDGGFHAGLWTYGGESNSANTLAQQKDGVLVISRQLDGRSTLDTLRPRTWSVDQLGFVEAKLMLDGNIEASEWGDVYVGIAGPVNGNDWWTVCYILGRQGESEAWASCNTSDYEGNGLAVQFNSWHAMRFEINPDTAVVSFFVDGQHIDSYVHANPEAFKKAQFYAFVGVWPLGGGLVTGYIDDVRIGPLGH